MKRLKKKIDQDYMIMKLNLILDRMREQEKKDIERRNKLEELSLDIADLMKQLKEINEKI